MYIPAVVRAMVARGVPEGTAKSVANDLDEFRDNPNSRTTDTPNSSNQWNDFNAGTVKNDDNLMQGFPRSANGASAPEQGTRSSNESPQHGGSEAHQALGESLTHAIGVAVKSEIDPLRSTLLNQVAEIMDSKLGPVVELLSGASRKALEAVRPPSFAKSATVEKAIPELAKADRLPLLSQAISRASDSGILSFSEAIHARRILSHAQSALIHGSTDLNWSLVEREIRSAPEAVRAVTEILLP